MAKVLSVEIQILLLLADPILVANIRASALLLEIRMELLMLSSWLRYVLEALPIYPIVVALREVGHRHKLTRLVRYDRLRLGVTIALICGRRHYDISILAMTCGGTRLGIVLVEIGNWDLIWGQGNRRRIALVRALRNSCGQVSVVPSADALCIVDLTPMVRMTGRKPRLEYTKLILNFIASSRFRRGASFRRFSAPLVKRMRFQSDFFTSLNVFFYGEGAVVLLDLSVDAESIIAECN